MPSLSQLAGRFATVLPGGRGVLSRAAGGARADRAAIFMLHRVLPDPGQCYDPEMVVSLAAFEAFLAWLREHYAVLPLEELLGRVQRTQRRGQPACALTFDDGWVDTFAHAFPLLQRWRLPATVFLPLQYIGTDRRFWQERLYYRLQRLRAHSGAVASLRAVGQSFAWCPELQAADLDFPALRARLVRRSSPEAEAFVERLGEATELPLELTGRAFMNWDEVRLMQDAGIRFGSHTLDHTLLRCAPPAAAAEELRRSRRALSEQLGEPVTTFSYPWGGLSPFTRAQVREAGYSLAVTTRPGLVRASSDAWLLPRIALSDAQLGWGAAPAPAAAVAAVPRFRPATLQVHLARARGQRTATSGPGVGGAAAGPERLRLGFLVDNPQSWADQPQEHLGGSELQLLRLLEALDPEHFAVELYFLRAPAEGLPTRQPWPCFAAAGHGAGRLATILGVRRLLRQRRPAVVQAMFQDSIFLGVPAAWLARVPSILCARRNAGYWKRWHHRAALRVINRMANAWQVNAEPIAAMLQSDEGVSAAAIEMVPNWLDLERFHPASRAERLAARQRLGLDEEALVAVSVANYWPVKRLDTVVAAAAQVCRARPEARFYLLGEGPERAGLTAQIEGLGLAEQVRLTGAVETVEQYLAAADVGVLSSSSEGCSNAALEYMAAGLPLVLSDVPGNRALAAGTLVPVGDAAAWAKALLRLAADPTARAQQGRAHRIRAEQYGGGAFQARVQSHYTRVAGAGQGAIPRHRRPEAEWQPDEAATPSARPS